MRYDIYVYIVRRQRVKFECLLRAYKNKKYLRYPPSVLVELGLE